MALLYNDDDLDQRAYPENLTCKHCGAECYWQEVYGKNGEPRNVLFEDGKPHACKPSADDFEVLP